MRRQQKNGLLFYVHAKIYKRFSLRCQRLWVSHTEFCVCTINHLGHCDRISRPTQSWNENRHTLWTLSLTSRNRVEIKALATSDTVSEFSFLSMQNDFNCEHFLFGLSLQISSVSTRGFADVWDGHFRVRFPSSFLLRFLAVIVQTQFLLFIKFKGCNWTSWLEIMNSARLFSVDLTLNLTFSGEIELKCSENLQ